MTEDGRHLAAEALTGRMASIGLSQQDLAQKAGVSTSTIRKIQREVDTGYQPHKLAALSRALDWPPGTLDRLLIGIEIQFTDDWEVLGVDQAREMQEQITRSRTLRLRAPTVDQEPDSLSALDARLSPEDRDMLLELGLVMWRRSHGE